MSKDFTPRMAPLYEPGAPWRKQKDGAGPTRAAGFTPGPWTCDHHSSITAVEQRDKSKNSVVTTPGHGLLAFIISSGSSESEANGNLIAAAPDLFAACQAQMRTIIAVLEGRGESRETIDYYTLEARAALAKAEGRDATISSE